MCDKVFWFPCILARDVFMAVDLVEYISCRLKVTRDFSNNVTQRSGGLCHCFFGTAICDDERRLLVYLFLERYFVGTSPAFSIELEFCIAFSSIVMAWILTSMIENGAVVWAIRLFCLAKDFFFSAIKVSGGRLRKRHYPTVNVGRVWIFFSKYRFYLYCRWVKEFDTLYCMAASWSRMFRHRTLRSVAYTKLSGNADGTTTVVGPNGCLDSARLNGASLVEQCTGKLYMYVNS